jgi:cytochrome c
MAGSVGSFEYSEALRKSRVRWTEKALDEWLTDTERVAPDNDMAFRVVSAEERRAIIEYLKSGV